MIIVSGLEQSNPYRRRNLFSHHYLLKDSELSFVVYSWSDIIWSLDQTRSSTQTLYTPTLNYKENHDVIYITAVWEAKRENFDKRVCKKHVKICMCRNLSEVNEGVIMKPWRLTCVGAPKFGCPDSVEGSASCKLFVSLDVGMQGKEEEWPWVSTVSSPRNCVCRTRIS